MALLGTPRTAEMRYRDVSAIGLVRSPDSATTTIHVQFTLDESQLFLVDLEPDPNNPPPPSVPCADYLVLGATMTLTSDDGAFNEVVATEFATMRPDRLTQGLSIPAKDMRGSFALSNAGANDSDRFVYSFSQIFLDDVWLGRVDAMSFSIGPQVVFDGPPFADWGSAPCSAGATPIVQGTTDFTLAAQATSIITAAPVSLAFSDGTSTVAHLSFPQSPLACRVEDQARLGGQEGTILLTGPLGVTSDDGRWTGTLSGHGSADVTAGALSSLRLYVDAPTLAPTEFAAYYGFSGVDFTGHTEAHLDFHVEYAVNTPVVTAGSFAIWGPNNDDSGMGSLLLSATVGGI